MKATILGLLLLVTPAWGQEQPVVDVRPRVNAVILAPEFRAARIGVHAVALDTGEVLYTHDADKLFLPASNMKLFSTALALLELGPQYRWRTSVYAASKPDKDGAIAGSLVLYGRGDPSISRRFKGVDPVARIDVLAERIAASGVRRVDGGIEADESYFRGERFGEGWEWNDLQWRSGAEVSALSFGDNVVELTVAAGRKAGDAAVAAIAPATSLVRLLNRTKTVAKGGERFIGVYRAQASNVVEVWGTIPVGDERFEVPVAVHDPAELIGDHLRTALERRGVEVKGDVRAVDWRQREARPFDVSKAVELAWIEGETLGAVVHATNRDSQNLYAELLLRTVGKVTGSPTAASDEAGAARLVEMIRASGADAGPIVAVDGSGLSKRNMVTPDSLVRLLRHMHGKATWSVFLDSLPIAASSGTLRNRFKETSGAGKIRAKTGTVSFVATLTGVMTTRSGREVAFSVMVNNQPRSGPPAQRAVDQIVLALQDL